MKSVKHIISITSMGISLFSVPVLAQSTNNPPTPPVVVEKGKVPIPADIQALVKKFDAERAAYLTEQAALLAKLKGATTADQREAIRTDLQANRTAFLTDLKAFRQDLKQQIEALKVNLNNPEIKRLIEEVKHEVEEHSHHAK